MWRLDKCRGLFFARTGESPRLSFWRTEQDRLAARGVARQFPDDALRWDPSAPDSRSNCPELHDAALWLTGLVGPMWRARTRNIYVGRTTKSDVTAFGEHTERAGMVALSIEYSMALVAYINVYARFLHALDLRLTQSPATAASVLDGMAAEFRGLMDQYRADSIGTFLLDRPWTAEFPTGTARVAHDLIRVSETYVVAHELAHHIVRHASSRPDRDAKAEVARLLSDPAMTVETEQLSPGQLTEVEADALAFLMMTGRYADREDPALVLLALNGAMFALVAIGHLNDEWHTDRGDTHPGCLTRIAVIAKLACLQFRDSFGTVDTAGALDTLPRITASLVSFATWAARVPAVPDSGAAASEETPLLDVLANHVLAATILAEFQPDHRIPLLPSHA